MDKLKDDSVVLVESVSVQQEIHTWIPGKILTLLILVTVKAEEAKIAAEAQEAWIAAEDERAEKASKAKELMIVTEVRIETEALD